MSLAGIKTKLPVMISVCIITTHTHTHTHTLHMQAHAYNEIHTHALISGNPVQCNTSLFSPLKP